jgi:protein TonB
VPRRRPAPVAKPQAPLPAPEPEPATQSRPGQGSIEEPAAQAPAPFEPPSPIPPQTAPPPPAPAALAERAAEFDRKLLATYRLEIIQLARQFKRYPPIARENNWEGRAEVRLSFAPGGRRPSVDLIKSSGYPILDRQAIDTLAKAVVPLPEALRGRQFALDVPVIFNLDD